MQSAHISPEEKLRIKELTYKPMLWLGMVSIIMFFAGLTSAYVVRQAQGDWLYFDIPPIFYASTMVLLSSSFTVWMAQRAIRSGNNKRLAQWLLVTLILGLIFAFMQVLGWLRLAELGIHFTGPGSNISGSFFIALVFAHAAHVAGGIFALIFTWIKARMSAYYSDNHAGVKTTALYWHFMDALWIYLLLFLVFIR